MLIRASISNILLNSALSDGGDISSEKKSVKLSFSVGTNRQFKQTDWDGVRLDALFVFVATILAVIVAVS